VARGGFRWRTFGVAVSLAALVALLAAVIEGLASGGGAIARSPTALLYAFNLHLLVGLALALLARLVFWRASEIRFPPLVLGLILLVELAVVVPYWLTQASYTPPFYRLGGKLLFSLYTVLGVLLALLLARLIAVRTRTETWLSRARGAQGGLGIAIAIAALLLNAVFIVRAVPRPVAVTVRPEAAQMERPPVIFLLVDTLRRDHLSGFGYERPTSPRIDQLLAESYVFRAAQTPSTWTIPSVASLFTGLYPTSHRMLTGTSLLPEEAPLLAEHFRSYGYRTGAFVANQILTHSNGYSAGFEHFFPSDAPWWTLRGTTAFERLATRLRRPGSVSRGWRINVEALQWVRLHQDEPLFAYVHYLDPHSPYLPMENDLAAVAPDAPGGIVEPPRFHVFEDQLERDDCRDWRCLEDPPEFTPRELEGMLARYDGEIHQTDRRIGDLLDELQALGILDRCHLVFLTDHGEEFGDHEGWYHGNSIYEEMIATPLAYRPPGGLAEQRIIERPTPMIDMPYTLCRLLGLEIPPLHQGREIPELLGQEPPAREVPVLTELPPTLFAVRAGDWKLVRRGPEGEPVWELYDLGDDPEERNDLAAALPDTVAWLRGYMEGRVAELAQQALDDIATTSDPALLEQLRTLGYIR